MKCQVLLLKPDNHLDLQRQDRLQTVSAQGAVIHRSRCL